MMNAALRKQLVLIRKQLNLPSLTWKYADEKKSYQALDRAMVLYLKRNVYAWYFRDILIYDQQYDLPYFFERVILTRKQVFFIISQRVPFAFNAKVEENYWSGNDIHIVSPIVLQQFMINRLLLIVDVKPLLNTAVKNVVLLKTSHVINLEDELEYENIKVIKMNQQNLNGFFAYLDEVDRLADDVMDDETIKELYDFFARHCGKQSKKAVSNVLYCMYHRL